MDCLYHQVFETAVPRDSKFLYGMRFAPHPFILAPPDSEAHAVKKDEQFRIGLTLLGDYDRYLHYFVRVLESAGSLGVGKGRKSFQVLAVENQVDGLQVYDGETLALERTAITLPQARVLPEQVTLHFRSPLRIIEKKKLLQKPDRPQFLRSMLRRAILLNHFHGDGQEILDRDEFHKALRQGKFKSEFVLKPLKRYSNRQRRYIPMNGVNGSVTFDHLNQSVHKALQICAHTHMGKGASFGLGRFTLMED